MARRILRRLPLTLALILAVLVITGVLFLKTEAGLRTAIALGTSLAASDDLTVEVGEVSGAIASDFTLTDIRVADRDGVWLTVDRARLDWSPSALLSGVLSAANLDVGRVAVLRRPVPATAETPAREGSSLPPVGIRIDRFAVADIDLAEPVAGAAARLRAEGSARLVDPAEGLRLTAEARRIDGRTGAITARLGYVPDTGAIDARVSASEPAGGVVARLLDLPGLPPVELLIDGTGRLDAGLVTVALSAGDAGRIDATTRLARAEGGTRVDIDARGAISDLVPAAYRRLVEDRTTLAARLVIAQDAKTIAVERAQFASLGLAASAAGLVDLAADTSDIRFELTGGEAERFAGIIPAPVRWGEVRIAGRATGALTRPVLAAHITGADLAYDNRRAGSVAADVAVRPEGDAMAIAADITADRLALALPVADQMIGEKARIVLDSVRRADGSFEIKRFDLKGAQAELGFTGTASPDAVDGTASVASPRVTLTAKVTADNLSTAPSGHFALDGTADGAPVTGQARFAMEPGGVRLDDLDLRTRSARLVGGMLATPDAPRGDIRLTIGDLTDLAPFLPVEARGAIEGRIVLEGEGPNAEARITASGSGIVASGTAIERASLDATVADPFGSRRVDGRLSAANISAGAQIPSVTLGFTGPYDAIALTLAAEAMGGSVNAAGTLSAEAMALALDRLDVVRQSLRIALAEPSRLTMADGGVATEGLTLTAGGGRVTAKGRAGSSLDLDLAFERLPLALAETVSPGLGLAGTLSGSAALKGTPAAPSGGYDLAVAGLSAAQTRDFGLGAFAVKAGGTLAEGRTNVTVTATGGGTNLKLTGSAPLGAGTLDLRANGTVDAGLINTKLAATGERLAGTVTLDLTVKGTTSAPSVGGSARLAGGRFTSPGLGLDLTNMAATVSGDGRALSLSAFSAATAGGGRLTGEGRVSVDPAGGFPGSLTLTAANAEVANTKIVKARADARISLEGPLAREPRVGGTITLRRMEITLPERFPAGSSAIQVEHRNAPPAVRRQLARQEAEERQAASESAFTAALDLTVNAPNQIFLRGQGIEAELSGNLRVRGTTAAPQIDGGLETRRGTLSVLGQRLVFTRGIVTFPGDITPVLDLLAETKAGDVTAYIAVTGSASQPGFALSSQPTLPQDEVMARLLFNRATGELSPGQAIQIAQALASFSGAGGGPGALDSIRRGLGVDTLDVTTDASGGPAVAVGRYINDNISIGARQGATPESSRVTVDIDVTERIKIQGEAGADGNSKVGVGVEWEY